MKDFLTNADLLFDICSCKCKMLPTFAKGQMMCSCQPEKRILEAEYDFILDQRTARKMYIGKNIDKELTNKYVKTQERRNKTDRIERTINLESFSSSTNKLDDSLVSVVMNKTRGILRSYEESDEEIESVGWKVKETKDKDYIPETETRCTKVVRLMNDELAE